MEMNGGLMKTTSRFAIAAAASVIATNVLAADLGGNCCADLEERVAELEATAARKGNRRVSLTVYGHVNEAVLWWDDGEETNAYVVTNENSRTRFGFRGDARISPEWSAGYLLEVGVRSSNSATVNQLADDLVPTNLALDLRHGAWWIESNRLGRVWVGQTSMATDGITEINLSNAAQIGSNDINNWNGGFFLRLDRNDRLLARGTGPGGVVVGLTWAGINSQANANVGDGDRRNLVRYVSPTFSGFTFSWSWGEDDFWDVALRYANEWNGVRVAAGIGFQQWTDGDARTILRENGGFDLVSVNTGSQGDRGCADLDFVISDFGRGSDVDCSALGLSASVMHVPTGLYITGAYGRLQDENRRLLFAQRTDGFVRNADDTDQHWYIQAGVERNFFGLGKTTVYGEFFQGDTGGGLSSGDVRNIGGLLFPLVDSDAWITSSSVDVWGFGLVQTIDAAAMDLYIGFRNYSGDADITFLDTQMEYDRARRRNVDFEDFQAVFSGGIIRF
jgi:predicted porin